MEESGSEKDEVLWSDTNPTYVAAELMDNSQWNRSKHEEVVTPLSNCTDISRFSNTSDDKYCFLKQRINDLKKETEPRKKQNQVEYTRTLRTPTSGIDHYNESFKGSEG